MKRSDRMKIVQSVAEHEERQEIRAMAESQKKLEDEFVRLEELKAYRHGYAELAKLKDGVHALQWQDYQLFLTRLTKAVVMQEDVVRDGKSKREVHKKRWMVKRQRLESLSRVVERYTGEETGERERQLRKIQDSQPIRPGPYDQKD